MIALALVPQLLQIPRNPPKASRPFFLWRKVASARTGWIRYSGPFPSWEEAHDVRFGIASRNCNGTTSDYSAIERAFYVGQRSPVDRWGRPRPEVSGYRLYEEQPWIG